MDKEKEDSWADFMLKIIGKFLKIIITLAILLTVIIGGILQFVHIRILKQ